MKLAKALRDEGVASVELPGVKMTLHRQSHVAETSELDLAQGSREASRAAQWEPYLASGYVPVNLRERRRKASGE